MTKRTKEEAHEAVQDMVKMKDGHLKMEEIREANENSFPKAIPGMLKRSRSTASWKANMG